MKSLKRIKYSLRVTMTSGEVATVTSYITISDGSDFNFDGVIYQLYKCLYVKCLDGKYYNIGQVESFEPLSFEVMDNE